MEEEKKNQGRKRRRKRKRKIRRVKSQGVKKARDSRSLVESRPRYLLPLRRASVLLLLLPLSPLLRFLRRLSLLRVVLPRLLLLLHLRFLQEKRALSRTRMTEIRRADQRLPRKKKEDKKHVERKTSKKEKEGIIPLHHIFSRKTRFKDNRLFSRLLLLLPPPLFLARLPYPQLDLLYLLLLLPLPLLPSSTTRLYLARLQKILFLCQTPFKPL